MAAQDASDIHNKIQEENCFLTLFRQVVEVINRGRASEDEISESIQKFVDFCRNKGKPAGVCAESNFLTPEDFLGYFYWISPVSAGVTRHKTLAAIQECEEFRSCFDRPSLNVVSVGGGTGSDLVGLCSALYGNCAFQSMEVTLIDDDPNWERFFLKADELLRNGDFGNASRLIRNKDIVTSFICAGMPLRPRQNMIAECKNVLAEAQLVWMKGFLSVLDSNFERFTVTGKIIECMVPGSLLVVMESLAYDQFDEFVRDNQLRRVFNTNERGYFLQADLEPFSNISKSTNQEMIIFEKI